MKREDLIAPEKYNLVSEMERFAKDPNRVALKWENETGETKQVTYQQLMKKVKQSRECFRQEWFKQGRCGSCNHAASN